ncbi:MAG: ABC transporter permease [Alphaproteobacteria bacterium]|nr:ABC transporter permease [Alphaproteobacteria bacterium]
MDPAALRAAARAGRRREQRRAALLVAPLFLFLLLTFVGPIGSLLWRGVTDSEVAGVLPRTTAALGAWNGEGLPPDSTFAALIEDMREAYAAGTLAPAATRLNYDVNGFRTLMFGTARRLRDVGGGNPREGLVALDPKWGERETWAAISRAGGPFTDLYVLAAVDLRRDAANQIVAVPDDQAVFRAILGRTFWIAAVVTLTCAAIGFPVAYLLASLKPRTAGLLLIFVLLPFWTSLLVRTTAWVVLLQREGIVNSALLGLGLVEAPLRMIFNRFAVYVAIVYVLLPFMILPLYGVMRSIPSVHLRAAASLGARPWTVFRRIYLPQALPGVGAGVLLVFIQALGYYITPALVGGADDQMISYFIAFYASRTVNWGMAGALSLLLLIATSTMFALFRRLGGLERLGVR